MKPLTYYLIHNGARVDAKDVVCKIVECVCL